MEKTQKQEMEEIEKELAKKYEVGRELGLHTTWQDRKTSWTEYVVSRRKSGFVYLARGITIMQGDHAGTERLTRAEMKEQLRDFVQWRVDSHRGNFHGWEILQEFFPDLIEEAYE